ncbi:uncharacterized protein UV8b_01549 [Ustilaginoidea virens]|uniref:Uncharacterized protein n=1 Tax=Ustilaginoidea virens TaxID=1159556 RepID=A0A8E5HL69_USTVR|nr:uncharacterized protein UV8b_01549 [Ustilaginoidea virens]QUC17308.1 hypothetical protein UV8b_01549 [Ustilaginoidea virens]
MSEATSEWDSPEVIAQYARNEAHVTFAKHFSSQLQHLPQEVRDMATPSWVFQQLGLMDLPIFLATGNIISPLPVLVGDEFDAETRFTSPVQEAIANRSIANRSITNRINAIRTIASQSMATWRPVTLTIATHNISNPTQTHTSKAKEYVCWGRAILACGR